MSREVRRVPVGYKHPHEYNPHWKNHAMWELNSKGKIFDKGIPRDQRFIGLLDGCDYKSNVERDKKTREELKNREGFTWNWEYNRCFVGYESDYYGKWMEPDPRIFRIDKELKEEVAVEVHSPDHLLELLLEDFDSAARSKDEYTPIPEVDADTDGYGYCLYETVSEGTPVTPVFATAEELIDHLVNVGNFWGETYDRRNAEALVGNGGSYASAVFVNGEMLDSTRTADVDDALGK